MARTPGKKPNPIAAFFGFGLGKPASAPSREKQAKPRRARAAKPLRAETTAETPSQELGTPLAGTSSPSPSCW